MTNKHDNGGPAFPHPGLGDPRFIARPADGGMSLRDWFAGQALASVFQDNAFGQREHYEALAVEIFKMADAMIAARGQQ